jgi:hypothetical protein
MLRKAFVAFVLAPFAAFIGCSGTSNDSNEPPASVREVVDLRDTSNAVDYLVVAAPGLSDAARAFAAYRQSSAGGALGEVAIVTYPTVTAAFDSGSVPPLQALLSYTLDSWRRAPTYVLLLGRPSECVPDYDTSAQSRYDNLYADPDTDGVVEFRVGRLPLATNALATNALAAVKAYEVGAHRSLLMIVDDSCQWNQWDGIAFGSSADRILDAVDTQRYAVSRFNLAAYVIPCQWTDSLAALAHDALQPRLDTARGIVCFVGHGNTAVWADEGLVTMADTAHITGPAFHLLEGGRVCDYTASQSVVASLLGRGAVAGAIGCRSAAYASQTAVFMLSFVAALSAAPQGATAGELNKAAHEATGAGSPGRSFVLLGDPALRLP